MMTTDQPMREMSEAFGTLLPKRPPVNYQMCCVIADGQTWGRPG